MGLMILRMVYLDNDFSKIEELLKKHNFKLEDIAIDSGNVRINFDNNVTLDIEYVEYEGLSVKLMGNI